MTNTLQTMNNTTMTTAPAGALQAHLFMEFIENMDRSEKTTRTYITNLRQFAAWLKYAGITRPTRHDIIAYKNYLTAEHDGIQLDPATAAGWSYRTDATGEPIKVSCKAATVKLYLQSVRQFFAWTADNGIYPNIAAGIRVRTTAQKQHKKDALRPENVLTIEKSIIDNAASRTERAAEKDRATEQGKRLHAMFMLSVTAGLRTVEISRANIKDIEVRNGTAFINIYGKGHEEADERKPLAPEVYDTIRDYLNSRTDNHTTASPLFVATGNRSGGKRLAPTTISTMLKKAMQQAGFDSETITAHSLRHTAGTNVQEITGNLYMTQKYMRHQNPATTEIYLHVETERQEAEIAQKLYNRYHGIEEADTARADIENMLDGMTAEQLQALAGIAQNMSR